MGNLVNQAEQAYSTWKLANMPSDVSSWSTLTDAEAFSLWRTEQQYKAAIEDARLIEDSFYAARTEAFQNFEITKQSEFVALQNMWQMKEDSGYYVDA